jgi:hypothetical protein
MSTECSPDFFGFEPVEGRAVVAAFDAGAVTSDAGALLLGATDRTIRMMDRLASCFDDVRCPELIEHQVVTLVGQRVFGIALGYEDLNDHDELRHDPVEEVARIVAQIRRRWPLVRILLRADSGFAREELMAPEPVRVSRMLASKLLRAKELGRKKHDVSYTRPLRMTKVSAAIV